MPKNAPLAAKDYITPSDLTDLPLIVSRQAVNQELTSWGQQHNIHFNIACTYNLVFNAAIMAEEGFGYVLSLDKLVNTGDGSSLCFRPLKPDLKVNLSIAWKKYQIFSKASQKFLEYLKKEINA